MSAKNRKIQRKLKREEAKNKIISELKKAHLGFVSWENQPAVQLGKTEILTESIRQAKCKLEKIKETINFKKEAESDITETLMLPKILIEELSEKNYHESEIKG